MSVCAPIRRCLFSKASPLKPLSAVPSNRPFHSAPRTSYPRQRSKAVTPPADAYPSEASLPYSESDLETLSSLYPPSQLESLLAGELSINPDDFDRRQGRPNHDPFRLQYLTDLSKYDPLLDFPQNGNEYVPRSSGGHPEQPLPEIKDPSLTFPPAEDASAVYRGEDLTRLTGMTAAQLKRLTIRKMVFHRVVNQTRMGKIQRFYALNIAGNGNGLLGVGEGKSAEPGDASQIATYMAIRNMEPIPRYEGRTIFGNQRVKIGAVELELRTAPPGYGIRASEPIFEMCRAVGIQDLSAKITRSRNRMNVVKAVMEGLRTQRLPDTIARGRGLKLVDVRKVYYNGINLGGSSSMM